MIRRLTTKPFTFLFLLLPLAFSSCSKTTQDMLYTLTWQLESHQVAGKETMVSGCTYQDKYYFCYCGKLTIEQNSLQCLSGVSEKKINTFALSKDNQTLTIYEKSDSVVYHIETINENNLILLSQNLKEIQKLTFKNTP